MTTRPAHRGSSRFRNHLTLPALNALLLLAWLVSACALPASAAMPPAGFEIVNQASATYIPAGHQLPETISSNRVTALVAAVEALQLTADLTVDRPAGPTFALQHTLTNTGNVNSAYSFTLANLPGDGYDLANLRMVWDRNGNGIADAGEEDLLSGNVSLMLAPGHSAQLLVVGQVPVGTGTAQAQIRLTAATTGATPVSAANTDTIRTGSQAAVVLTKRADQSGTVTPGTVVNYQLVATNTGDSLAMPTPVAGPTGTPIWVDGTPAMVFLISDTIPAGTTYVPGTLATSLGNGLKLFRLPGDPPYRYRTNGDDQAAIEVAAASTSLLLTPGVTTDMRFAVRVRDSYSGPVTNRGDAFYFDGMASVQSPSNQVQLLVSQERIGLAKRSGVPEYEHDPVTGILLGTARVRMSFIGENFGHDPLYTVQVTDLLEGAGRFGSYTADARPGAGQYTIVAGSGEVASLRMGATAALNPAYTGTSANANLLAPGVTLPPAGAFEVSFELRVNVTGIDGVIYNTATATASLGSPAYATVRDDSVNGSMPDANGDGNPGNDASPTPTLLSIPAISVLKEAGTPRKVDAAGTWEVDYTLTVTNTGKGVATYVQLSDNLNCTFQMYRTPAPVQSWQLTGTPIAQKGLLQINPGYTGAAACSVDQATGSNPYQTMQLDPAVVLTDGSRHLNPGTTEIISYTVRFTADPLAKAEDREFTNRIYAGSFDRPNATSGELLAASKSDATVIPIDPSGVVYNAATRLPVAGAEVRLARVSCDAGSAGPLTAEEILAVTGTTYSFNADGTVSMTTGTNGAYFFFLKSPPVTTNCEYRLTVIPPADSGLHWPSDIIPPTAANAPGGLVQSQDTPPAGDQPTTYYLQVRLGPNLPIVLNNHIPLDPAPPTGGILLEKTAGKSVIEIGNMLKYTLRVKNVAGYRLSGFRISDRLPTGFRLISDSTRLNEVRTPDPAGAPGLDLTFSFPDLILDDGAEATVTYWVQSGIGTPLGDAVNRATAFSGRRYSNQAAARVRVDGGVFAEEAYLIGKVFLDCNGDGMQGHEEIGIPGVRLIMEDGTGVVTDVEGKYSSYGLRAITHVLKLDGTTLPPGAILEVLDNRNAGRGDSRFVDLKKGELHKANFAVSNCHEPSVVSEVERRRKMLAERPDAEGEAVSKARLDLQTPAEPQPSEVRSRSAAGELSPTGIKPPQADVTRQPAQAEAFESVMPRNLTGPSSLPSSPAAQLPKVDLEKLVLEADNSLAFIDLADGDTLPMALTNVRVKGRAGTVLRLTVNEQAVSEKRVGKRSKLADKQLEAWEYIGIELKPGRNSLQLEEIDGFGNVRGTRQISLVAPGSIGKIEIEAPKTAVADAATPIRIKVRLLDDNGVPVTVRTQMVLEIDNGRWETKDLNPDEPGTQVFMQGGSAEFTIIPPNEPLDATVRVSSGILQKEVKIAYLPELRPLIGAGILEGILDFRHKGAVPVSQSSRSAFEQTLRNMSWESDDGKRSAAGRAAFYFKGAVKGEYLLTAAFDSDKNTNERLFRDIQPDKYYPIYGDSSAKIFDAQSTERLYLRIDKQKSWILYGDFTTDADDTIRQLSKYGRSATGVKYHHENSRVSGNVYASNDNLRQKVEELPANGTSGPYKLSGSGEFYENSEKVEILVRDRNQPSVILQTIPMTRFTDYVIEPLNRQILFAAPVASLDENLNPRSIRVTYEVESGGPSFWMGGADAQVKITDTLQVGASYARDENPQNKATLAGATAVLKLAERSVVTAEVARSNTDLSGTGNAARLEWLKDSGDLKVRAQATTADDHFENTTSGFSKGRTEATLNSTYQLDKMTVLRAEGIYSKDRTTGGERKGLLGAISRRFGEYLEGEMGLRASRETAQAAQTTAEGTTPNDLLTMRGRLGSRIPWLENARAYLEGEQDLRESRKRMASVGGNYQIGEKTRLYGRYEFISSLGSPFALNNVQENNTAVVGVETAYKQDGRIFNEFRIRDSINGREAQAATGIRRTWLVTDGLRMGGSFERTSAFGGTAGSESTAVTGSLEYTGNKRYRLYGSQENRFADSGDSWLNTVGLAYKLNKDWSLLTRSAVSQQKSSGDGPDTTLSRQQIGFAWRQVDIDRWNALGRYEYNLKDTQGRTDPSRERTHILSLHVNYQPKHNLIASGRYAFKRGNEQYGGMSSRFRGHLLYGRLTQTLTKKFDASLQASTMRDNTGATKYSLGMEVGYQLITNLWLSVGHNLTGFRDDDLTGGEYVDRGSYIRLRSKFDEGLFR